MPKLMDCATMDFAAYFLDGYPRRTTHAVHVLIRKDTLALKAGARTLLVTLEPRPGLFLM